MKATPKGNTSRTRRASILAHKETSEPDEVGAVEAAVMVHVSAGEGMANANPTRTTAHEPPPSLATCTTGPYKVQQQQPLYVSPDTSCYNCNECGTSQHLALSTIGEGSVRTFRINMLSVGSPYTMALVILEMWLRGAAPSPLKDLIEVSDKENLLLDDPEEQVIPGRVPIRFFGVRTMSIVVWRWIC